jgi:hypothetical protein
MIFNVTENMHIQTQKIIDDKTGVKNHRNQISINDLSTVLPVNLKKIN